MKTCPQCQSQFEVTTSDLELILKVSPVINGKTHNLPAPTLCPPCRQQRRLAQINQINLYKRTCAGTGETIISNHPPESPYKTVKQSYWSSDSFNALDYGRDYDFNKPFFEQYHQLKLATPQWALFTDHTRDINSEYTNSAGLNKNCYLIFDSDENEECYYSYGINSCKVSSDCYRCQDLELCYEAIDSKNCYNCSFIQNSENCSDSSFLLNCISCKNCIMCSNLKQKEYHILNKPVSKEKFEQIRSQLDDHEQLKKLLEKFSEFRLKFPQRFMRGIQNENVTGDYLVNCKDCTECYDSMNLWDCKYCAQMIISAKDSLDCDECGNGELMYESNNVAFNLHTIRFVDQSHNNLSDLTYCSQMMSCSHCFGCIGLKNKKFCILNKQYTEEEYNQLLPKIIEHMRTTNEWGEYFPIWTSSFPYNITQAQEHYPLNETQAQNLGVKWHHQPQTEYQEATSEVPDRISETPDTITNEILSCEACTKNYQITKQELAFHKSQNIPLPKNCFHCRHTTRTQKRNPRHLYNRNCDKCETKIKTTFAPDRPEEIYCESCYQQALT